MTFAERRAATQARMATEYARQDAAQAAHRKQAQIADYNEYSFMHRPHGQDGDATIEQLCAEHRRLTRAQSAIRAAIEANCTCDDAGSHI
jgi:hypothetical protein